MGYYLGVDGGGTRTTAAVADENGKVIYKSVGKTINFYSVGMEKARINLSEIMEDIFEKTGADTFKSAFIGCSALDGEGDKVIVDSLCGGIIKSEKIKMNSDVFVALYSGECSVSRGVVICGTGSMVAGVNKENKIIVKGGWGHILGDGGSAYSIALNAIKEALKLYDENKMDEPIVKATQYFFEVDDLRLVIDSVYSEHFTKDMIANFAKSLSQLCEAGEEKALRILSAECSELIRTVCALVEEMKECELLCLYGGVFQNNAIFRDMFIMDFKKKYPNIKTKILETPPEESALKIARGIV